MIAEWGKVEELPPAGGGVHGALAGKRAADLRALTLVATIREVRAAGFVSRRDSSPDCQHAVRASIAST